ncbi:MAG: hypothetical protein NVSMB48_24990 [Marmoricola sp.]
MNNKQIMAKIERSSLGTREAAAARRTVTNERSRRVVANAAARQAQQDGSRKSGG